MGSRSRFPGFALPPRGRCSLLVWFGFLVVFGVAAPFAHTVSRSGSFAFVFAPIIMCGFGVGLVWFGKWLARNDAAWLTDVVKRALGATAGSSDGAQAFPAATAPTVRSL
jgi:hypothetical protein